MNKKEKETRQSERHAAADEIATEKQITMMLMMKIVEQSLSEERQSPKITA